MLDTKQRNRKISHIIESAIHDFCKVLGCCYYTRDEAIMVQNDDQDLFYVYTEFNKTNYTINIVCMVFQDLSISKATKLRAIHKEEIIAEYLLEADASLWFLDDTRLVMSYVIEAHYSDYTILKSKIILEAYFNVQNARKLKDMLEVLLDELESVEVN